MKPMSADWVAKALYGQVLTIHPGNFEQHHNELKNGFLNTAFHGQVDLAVIDTPWGRSMRSWGQSEHADLRLAVDFMVKEGGVVFIFCRWQDAPTYAALFTRKKRIENGTKGGPTHSKYELQPAAYCFGKNDSYVCFRPSAPHIPTNGWEMGIVLYRMRTPSGTGQHDDTKKEFYLERHDRQININEASHRFGGVQRPNDGAKWINTHFANIDPPRGHARLQWPKHFTHSSPCDEGESVEVKL
jgi:hypothetical protein